MERLLTALERRFGRHAPEGIILWIVGLSGFFHLVVFAKPELWPWFQLIPEAVLQGEVWRVFTFVLAPAHPVDTTGLIFTGFGLWLLHTMGSALEAQWGSLRFDLYVAFGWLGTLAVAFLVGPVTGTHVASVILLAFALEFPDFQILLLIIPVKVKYIGILTGAFMVYQAFTGSIAGKAAAGVALLDFLLFCGPALLAVVRRQARSARRPSAAAARFGPEPRKPRVCARCGKSSADDPNLEFRVCDCQERCHGKLTEYCLEHAKAH
jgi:hypothetical protein